MDLESGHQFDSVHQLESGFQFQPRERKTIFNDPDLLRGFSRTSRFLAADPDKSAVIVKRFDQLSIRNLLNLEGRVAALDHLQREFDKEDSISKDDDILNAAYSWEDFALLGTRNGRSGKSGIPQALFEKLNKKRARQEGLDKAFPDYDVYNNKIVLDSINNRWEVAMATQHAIKEYQEAVLRYHDMLSLERPAKRTIEAVQSWFEGTLRKIEHPEVEFRVGTGLSKLFKPNSNSGSTELNNEFVSLRPIAKDDPVSKRLRNSKRFLRYARDKTLSDYDFDYVPEEKINKLVTLLGLGIAVIFLVAAIWILWVSERTHFTIRLGVLTVFVILFGGWVNFATNATRSEVFGATAAYAAVLVVFVGKG